MGLIGLFTSHCYTLLLKTLLRFLQNHSLNFLLTYQISKYLNGSAKESLRIGG